MGTKTWKPFLFSVLGAGVVLVLVLTSRPKTSRILRPNPRGAPPRARRHLLNYRATRGDPWDAADPRTVVLKEDGANDVAYRADMQPLRICDRAAPIAHDADMEIMEKYSSCPLLDKPPEETTLLVLEGLQTFGRTGNNLIEFLHALQYGFDFNVVVAIKHGSWAAHLIPIMWIAVQNDDIYAWRNFIERTFCLKFFDDDDDLVHYERIIKQDTRDLFLYKGGVHLNEYIEFQGHVIRSLWRSYNKGIGLNMHHKPVDDMCSVMDAMFGPEKQSAVYSVIHSRSLEGEPGLRLMQRISEKSGCDPVAALDMEPEYVKAILGPLGMLHHPILFITDHQRPEILEKLLEDSEIGPNILLVPDEASWIGGDITVAMMSNVFIGVPASSFTGFIAKSRVALGFENNFLFRKKNQRGRWVDVCDHRCIFDKSIMNAMA